MNVLELISQLKTTAPWHSQEPGRPRPLLWTDQMIEQNASLSAATDEARKLKKNAAKIALLIINEPFTPSAITKELRNLVQNCIVGLSNAIELCDPWRYTCTMSAELAHRSQILWKELETFVTTIPEDGKVLSKDQQKGNGQTKGNGSLAETGLLWQACDSIIELGEIGILGLFDKKTQTYRDQLKDALEELKEWGEEEGEDDDENSHDEGDSMCEEDMFDQRPIPKSDPDRIRPRLDTTTQRARTICLLYNSVIKRRFKSMPGPGKFTLPVDLALRSLSRIPEVMDELVGAFYDLNPGCIDRLMGDLFTDAVEVVDLLALGWAGESDEFTKWAAKFKEVMHKRWEEPVEGKVTLSMKEKSQDNGPVDETVMVPMEKLSMNDP